MTQETAFLQPRHTPRATLDELFKIADATDRIGDLLRERRAIGQAIMTREGSGYIRVAGFRTAADKVRQLVGVFFDLRSQRVIYESHSFGRDTITQGCTPKMCKAAELPLSKTVGLHRPKSALVTETLINGGELLQRLVAADQLLQNPGDEFDPVENRLAHIVLATVIEDRGHVLHNPSLAQVAEITLGSLVLSAAIPA